MRWLALLALIAAGCAVDCPEFDASGCPTSSCVLNQLKPFDRDHGCFVRPLRPVCIRKSGVLVPADARCVAEVSTGALFLDFRAPHVSGGEWRDCTDEERTMVMGQPDCP